MGLVKSAERRIATKNPVIALLVTFLTYLASIPGRLQAGMPDLTVREAALLHPKGRKAHRMAVSEGLMERIIGGGFMLVIGIIMLGFLFDLDLVANFSGPFADQLSTVETVLGAAIVFAVLGILALAGVYAYSMFRSQR